VGCGKARLAVVGGWFTGPMPPKYVVYVDESGNAEGVPPGHQFPIFLLALCVFDIEEYVQQVVPKFQTLKFEFFGHDLVVLHEREIRRKSGEFKVFRDPSAAFRFQRQLTEIIESSNFQIIAEAVHVEGPQSLSLYSSVLGLGLSRLDSVLHEPYVLVLESRGKRQDKQVFESLENRTTVSKIKFATKETMSTGLQIADLVARPIAMNILKPDQVSRAFEAIRAKIMA
jgi:hypothetical protein